MDNQGTGGSGGRGKRQSSLPSSLIPLMYTGPQRRRGSASPSQTENPESTENPPSSTTQFTFIPSSPTPAFTLRPIDSPADVPTPDERQLQTSRLRSASPGHDKQDNQRVGSSSIPVDTQIETRLGGETITYGFQPPQEPYTPFTFPAVPRFQNMPYSYLGENDAGPSTISQASRETITGRQAISRRDPSHPSVLSWPRPEQGQSSLGESKRHEWTDEQLRHEERQRQRQRPSEARRPAGLVSQQGESFIAEPSASVPTYRPVPTPSNPPVTPVEGLQLTTHPGPEPPPAYYANPYVAQTQSYTQIAPQYYPRYYDVPPIATVAPRQGYHLQYPDQRVTPTGDQSHDSGDDEASTTSRRRGKGKQGTADDGGKRSSRGKGKRTRTADEEFDEDDDDDLPRRKVPRKTEVACNFCRRRKLRCDGMKPTCRTCETRNAVCTYVDQVRRRGPGKAPKGTKKLAKRRVAEIDPFTNMMDLSHQNRPFVAHPESVASMDTLPRYSPPTGGPMYPTPQVPPRNAHPPHIPSQSPGASTSEREAGQSGERRHRKRTASQRDRSKRTRRDPETEETDDASHDPHDDDDDDMLYDG